ncbi:MAG: SRPBCC domain-containing protein [Burkholderiaceae bacterium]|nr:SRPBCC domain-containing protein [Burkholderiaceae bacterium]
MVRTADTGTSEADAVFVRRVIAVARERVFDAWLDPASLARWMTPCPGWTATARVDPRVGGSFCITMIDRDRATEHSGEYLLIERPSRLSFTWISVHTDDRPTVVTVEFHSHGEGTELVLTHRKLPPAQANAHREGWTEIVRQFTATLTGVA